MKDTLVDGLRGASLKIDRANEHISELVALINAGNSKGPQISADEQGDGGEWIFFQHLDGGSERAALIIGDAVHNLRSALDHAWTAFARTVPGKESSRVYFPFHETRNNLEDALKKSFVVDAFPIAREVIIDQVRPHADQKGDSIFWSLTKLDKIDKHNLLIPVLEVNSLQQVTIIRPDGGTIRIGEISVSNTLIPIDLGPGFKFKEDVSVSIDVKFKEPASLSGKEVVPTLVYLSQTTRKTIDLLSKMG